MRVKKIVSDLPDPSRAYEYDAGLDLYSSIYTSIQDREIDLVGTGLAVEIQRDYVGLVIIRSSIGMQGLSLVNSVGVIDSGYRGEIQLPLIYNHPANIVNHDEIPTFHISKGDKLAQLLVVRLDYNSSFIDIVDELNPSHRGERGFGSSD